MGKPKLTLRSCKRTQRYTPRPLLGHQGGGITTTLVNSVRPGGMKPKQNADLPSATRTRLAAQRRSRSAARVKPDETKPGHTASSSQNTAACNQNTASSNQSTASSSQNTSSLKSFHDSYKLYVSNNSPGKFDQVKTSKETDGQPKVDESKKSSPGQISQMEIAENNEQDCFPKASKTTNVASKKKTSNSKPKWRSRNARKRDISENIEEFFPLDSVHETHEETSQHGLEESSLFCDISASEKTRVRHNEGRVCVSHASVQVNLECSNSFQVCVDLNTNKRVVSTIATPVKTSADLNTNKRVVSTIATPVKTSAELNSNVISEMVQSELEQQKLVSHQPQDDQTLCNCTESRKDGVCTDISLSPIQDAISTGLHQSSPNRTESPPALLPIIQSILTSSDSDGGNTAGSDGTSEEETKLIKKCYPLRHQKPTVVKGTLPKKWCKRTHQPEQNDSCLDAVSKTSSEGGDKDPVLSKKQKRTVADRSPTDKTCSGQDTNLGNLKDCDVSRISRRMSPRGDASFVPVLKRMTDNETSPVKQTLLGSDRDHNPDDMQGISTEIRETKTEQSTASIGVKVSIPLSSLLETVGNRKTRMSRERHDENPKSSVCKKISAMSDCFESVAGATVVPPIVSDAEDEVKSAMGKTKDRTAMDSSDLERDETAVSHDELDALDSNDSVNQTRSATRNRRKYKPRKMRTDFNISKLSEQLDHNLTLDIANPSDACSRDALVAVDTSTVGPSSCDMSKKDESRGSPLCVAVDTDVDSGMLSMMQLSPLIPPCSEVDDFREVCEVVNEVSSQKDIYSEVSQSASASNSLDELYEETEDPLAECDQKLKLNSPGRGATLTCESGDRVKREIGSVGSSPGPEILDVCEGDSLTNMEGDDSGLCLLADLKYKNGEKMGIVDYSSSEEEFEDKHSEQRQELEESSGQPAEYNRCKAAEDQNTPKKIIRCARVRGNCGWEESLRQRPARTKLFQVGDSDSAIPASGKVKPDLQENPSSSEGKEDNTRGRVKMEVGKPKSLTRQNSSENEKPNGPVKTSPSKKCDTRSPNTSPSKKRGEGSPKNKIPEAIVLEDDEEMARVVEVEPNYGRLVWARLSGERWWPGMVIKGTLIYLQSERNSSSWIYWFGDHKVSQVGRDKILPFAENYMLKIGSFKSKIYRKAVLEALMECSQRSGVCVDTDNDTKLLQWAQSGFPSNVPGKTAILDPDSDCPIPESVMSNLREIGKDIRKKAAYVNIRNDNMERAQENAVDAVRKGNKELKDVCIACSDLGQPVKLEHPLFEGGLCAQCQNELVETMYAIGDDGLHSFCAVCGAGGDLFVCDSLECKRVYCRPCVEELGGEDVLNQVIVASKWQCFLCSPHKDQSECLLHPRSDWQERVIMFFDTGYRVQVPSLDYFKTKRPLRVLSLFDGIGSGKLTLDQMGFKVDVYYASEVEQDAIVVTQCNHGNSVTQVGDVKMLDDKELREMTPIDLLIGGSPCNDLSLANPNRRGFQEGSTALLFFEFVRIQGRLQELNGNTHLFWLYENVASMKTEFKNTMSRFLRCQPALWDSKYMSAQRRGRYFWGNIPGMYSTPAISTHMHEDVDLNSVLERNLDRRATIGKMGCVTTRSNSLKHGKNDELFPVEMKGEASGIWIPEVERLFGYPPHYTDVGNLPVSRRHKLLGKSWSIPIIKQIFAPLKRYFATEKSQ